MVNTSLRLTRMSEPNRNKCREHEIGEKNGRPLAIAVRWQQCGMPGTMETMAGDQSSEGGCNVGPSDRD